MLELRATDRALLTVEEAAELCGICRTSAYEAVRRGQLPSLRLGRRVFIPVPALLTLLDQTSTSNAS
jgi:excisionase family DNA binding protein